MQAKRESILKLFEQNGGILKLAQLTKEGINKYHLFKLQSTGEVLKIKHGLYCLSDCQVNQFAEIQKSIPKGIFCLYSAWFHYQLTTYIPHEQHIAIEKKSKVSQMDYPPVKIYYWDKSVIDIGRTSVTTSDQTKLSMYDLEKSVCDAVKFRNKIGTEMLNEVLNGYLKRQDRNMEKLFRYAKKLRVEKILKTYLEVLL